MYRGCHCFYLFYHTDYRQKLAVPEISLGLVCESHCTFVVQKVFIVIIIIGSFFFFFLERKLSALVNEIL